VDDSGITTGLFFLLRLSRCGELELEVPSEEVSRRLRLVFLLCFLEEELRALFLPRHSSLVEESSLESL
jgi:hypothetical protein